MDRVCCISATEKNQLHRKKFCIPGFHLIESHFCSIKLYCPPKNIRIQV